MKNSEVKKIPHFLEKFTKLKFIFPLLLIVCFLAYGLSLDMYFWKDDFALMIKAQNPEEPVGFFGPGIKGDGAYRYITVPFALLYPFFGLNAYAYFLVGIFLYFFSALGVYFLALEIFRDRLKALLSALIYSSGFIGADSIFGLTNSYQTSWVILFLTLTLTLFIRSFRTRDLGLYILSIFIFAITLETGYIRAHGFFLIMLSSGVLIIEKLSFNKITGFLIKLLPFFLIFKSYYLNSIPAQVGSSQFSKSLGERNYDYFLNPLITFINVFVPSSLINLSRGIISSLIGGDISSIKINLIWLVLFLILMLSFFVFLIVKKKLTEKDEENWKNLRILIFSLIAIFGSFGGAFFIGAASTYLESTHRYLSTAFIVLSVFWVSFFNLIFSKAKYKLLIPIIAVAILYLVLGNLYALENINSRTKPQKKFFSQLKKHLPEIKRKTFLYFDVSNRSNSQGKFGNIFGAGSVGGSPEITMHYEGVDRYDVLMSIGDFKDFVQKFTDNKGSIDNSFAFYFYDNELVNKTSEFREILKKGKTISIVFEKNISQEVALSEKNGKFDLLNTSFEINFPKGILTLTDGVLKFNLKIIPKNSGDMEMNLKDKTDENYLKYLLSKNWIKKNSKALVFSHFQNQKKENLFDGKNETTWMANRGSWHNIVNGVTDDIEFIEVYSGKTINLGGVLFTNGHTLRTPTSYKILIKEGNYWKEIKKTDFLEAKGTNEIWFDKFNPVLTDSIRLEILKSESGDAPQIAELELIDEQFSGLDFNKAQQIEIDPSILLKSNTNPQLVREYFGQNGKISFSYLTDKDNDYNVSTINLGIKGLNEEYDYEILIPSNGTFLVKGKFFNLNFPAEYIFSDFVYISPSLDKFISK